MFEIISRANALIDWLRENGGYFHPSTELKLDDVTGLSVYATSQIDKDQRLVSCPFELAITSEVATQAILEVSGASSEDHLVWPAQSSRAGQKWNERMRIGAYLGLHLVYQDKKEQSWPPALAHKIYLDSLPPPESLTTPLYFTDTELSLLEGSNLYGAVEDRKKEWREESNAVRAILNEDGLTWERYLAIATYMSSRAFPSRLLSLPNSGVSTTHPVQEDTDSNEVVVSQPVLLPGVDLFNHARGQPILWLSSLTFSSSSASSAGGSIPSISLVSAKSTSEGQIYNNYGAKPNEELLLGYGFVLDSNPDDIVNLRLGTSNIPSNTNEILTKKGLDAGKVFELRRDGEIDKELLQVVRIMLSPPSSDHNHNHKHDHGHGAGDEDEDEEDEHAAHAKEEKEMQLELDVLGMLGSMLQDKLDKLSATENTTDSETDVRPEVRRMIEIYRRGQVDILNAAMDKLEERIERIEGLLDEGMGGCPCGC